MRFCRTYAFKKTDPGQLNAARDLWFYSALPNVLLRLHLGRECYGLSIQPAVGILWSGECLGLLKVTTSGPQRPRAKAGGCLQGWKMHIYEKMGQKSAMFAFGQKPGTFLNYRYFFTKTRWKTYYPIQNTAFCFENYFRVDLLLKIISNYSHFTKSTYFILRFRQ